MLDKLDGQLRAWAEEIAGVNVSLDTPAPPTGKQKEGINLFLLKLDREHSDTGGARVPAWRLRLEYLVTAWAAKPEREHHLLGELYFAAMEHPDLEVAAGAPPIELWRSLGVPVRPGFLLRALARRERTQPSAPRLTSAPEVTGGAMTQLQGVLVGPGDIPIADARIEVPFLDYKCRSDRKGRFQFEAVPSDPPVRRLRVFAKGAEYSVSLAPGEGREEPVLIRIEIQEV